jgi:hypothetical protein
MGWTHRATAMSNLNWTTKKPTKPGWNRYKGKDPDIEFHADVLAIVEVIKGEDRLVCRHSNGDNERVGDSQAQWVGSPAPPE